jgi:hypothetical protein
LGAYKQNLHEAISKDRKCETSHNSFRCVGTNVDGSYFLYGIPHFSPLFPSADSTIRKILDHLYIHIALYKNSKYDGTSGDDPTSVKYLGCFFIEWDTGVPEQTRMIYNYDRNELFLRVENFSVSDKAVAESGVYSLVDFFPGFFRATPNVSEDRLCEQLPLENACIAKIISPLYDGLSLTEMELTFPYPKQLRVQESSRTICKAQEGNGTAMGLALQLPEDIEAIDSLGNIFSLKPEAERESACMLLKGQRE